MSEYKPDRWIMIRIQNEDQVVYKVFGCWYGGYLHGDSWKLNSGVTSVTETENAYQFAGASGSVYHCSKHSYGTSGYGGGVLMNMIEESKDMAVIEILPEETNFMELPYG